MTNYLKKLFLLPQFAVQLREQQIAEARLLALDHRAEAERHAALADMYDKRVRRLDSCA